MFEATDTPVRDVALYAGVGALVVSLVPLTLFRLRPDVGFVLLLVTFILAISTAFWVTRTHTVDVSGLGETTSDGGGGSSHAGLSVVDVSHGLTSSGQSRLRVLLLSLGVTLWTCTGFFAVAATM